MEHEGNELFRLVCERDLEGIVAKRKYDPYLLDGNAKWLKIRNPKYPRWAGREELFERERSSDPDSQLWNACASACDQLVEVQGENNSRSEALEHTCAAGFGELLRKPFERVDK